MIHNTHPDRKNLINKHTFLPFTFEQLTLSRKKLPDKRKKFRGLDFMLNVAYMLFFIITQYCILYHIYHRYIAAIYIIFQFSLFIFFLLLGKFNIMAHSFTAFYLLFKRFSP